MRVPAARSTPTTKPEEPSRVRCEPGHLVRPTFTPTTAAHASPTPTSNTPEARRTMAQGVHQSAASWPGASSHTGSAQPTRRYKCVRTRSPRDVSSRLSRYRLTKAFKAAAMTGASQMRKASTTMNNSDAASCAKPRNPARPTITGGTKSTTAKTWKVFRCITVSRRASALLVPADCRQTAWITSKPRVKAIGQWTKTMR
mmetsp:Transcript_43895/g.126794  ORF Transcript_43895/g.126794 Transcript_43895/m.126794 type:complete len:200 (-) Transcript_43895:330-929(-)